MPEGIKNFMDYPCASTPFNNRQICVFNLLPRFVKGVCSSAYRVMHHQHPAAGAAAGP